MSNADNVGLSYKAESTFGTAPTGSNYQDLRYTGDTLTRNAQTIQSAEITPDRQVTNRLRNDVNVSGTISGELSYGNFDELMRAALQSAAWTAETTYTASTISYDPVGGGGDGFEDVAAGFGVLGLSPGDWILVSGFTNTTFNGFYQVESADADSITLVTDIPNTEPAGDAVTITKASQITNGSTQPSYTFERRYTDLSNIYTLLTGVTVDTMSLSVGADSIVQVSFGMIGKNLATATSATGSGYDAATTETVMTGVDNVFDIQLSGSPLSVLSIGCETTNNLRERKQVGIEGAVSMGAGKFSATGTVEDYFDDTFQVARYLNYEAIRSAFVFTDSSGNSYLFDFPRVKYSSVGSLGAESENTDIIQTLNFETEKNTTFGYSMRIARWDAA